MQPVTFLEALKFAQSRNVVLPSEFYTLDLKTRQLSTTVSFLSSIEQIKSVINSVNKAIANGSTFQDFKKEVYENGIRLSPKYLDLVFRQNVQTAYSFGRWEQQSKNRNARPYLMYSAIDDDRVRPDHIALNRIIRHIDDPFWLMYYPPWAFRCFLPDVHIDGASKGAIKRFYTGKVVDIFTKSGRKISVTANHPILSRRGWIVAGDIKNGDDLLGYDRPIETNHINRCSGEINNNQSVICAKDLFKAFVAYALTFGKTSTLKLDSDIFTSNCQININILDSSLDFSVYSNGCERFSQTILIDRCNGGDLSADGFSSSSFCSSSIDAMLSEYSGNISSRCIEHGGEFLLSDILSFILLNYSQFEVNIAIPSGIPSSRALPFNSTSSLFDSLPLDRFGLASTSQDNTMFDELSRNGISCDFGLFRYLVDTHASNVFIDPVINIIERSYSGHVYDFQGNESLLSANGIITHNCRCSVISLTQEQAEKLGITPDDKLPQLDSPEFTTTPMTFGEMSDLTHKKIMESGIDPSLFKDGLEAVQAEWTASKKLSSLLSPMDDKGRDLFHAIFDTVLPLDPSIRPSTIKMFLDYVQGNSAQITAFLDHAPNTLATDVLRRWVKDDLSMLKTIAVNEQNAVLGSVSLSYAASFSVGEVISLNSPLFMANVGGDVLLKVENAKGLGIDAEKLNAGQGVLFEIGLSFEVVSIEHKNGKAVYTLRALTN